MNIDSLAIIRPVSLRLQDEGQKKLTDCTDAHGAFYTDSFFDFILIFVLILIVPCRTRGIVDGL